MLIELSSKIASFPTYLKAQLISRYLKKAKKYNKNMQTIQVEKTYLKILRLDHEHLEANLMLEYLHGVYAYNAENYSIAQMRFDLVLKQMPVNAVFLDEICVSDVLYKRGLCSFRQNNFQVAESYFTSALDCSKSCNYPIWKYRAETYIQLNQKELAILDLDKLIEISPTETKYLKRRAMLHYELLDYSKARQDYLSYLVQNPEDKESLYHAGILAFDTDDFSVAEHCFSTLLKVAGYILDSYFYLGLCYMCQKKYDLAISYLLLYQEDNQGDDALGIKEAISLCKFYLDCHVFSDVRRLKSYMHNRRAELRWMLEIIGVFLHKQDMEQVNSFQPIILKKLLQEPITPQDKNNYLKFSRDLVLTRCYGTLFKRVVAHKNSFADVQICRYQA